MWQNPFRVLPYCAIAYPICIGIRAIVGREVIRQWSEVVRANRTAAVGKNPAGVLPYSVGDHADVFRIQRLGDDLVVGDGRGALITTGSKVAAGKNPAGVLPSSV